MGKTRTFVTTLVLLAGFGAWATLAMAATPVQLRFLLTGSGHRLAAYETAVARFNDSHPDIQVELVLATSLEEQVKVMIAGDTLPDIFGMQAYWCFEIYDGGWAEPLDRFIERDGFDTDNLPPVRETFFYKGHWYGMPYNATGFMLKALIYNRDLFQRAGLLYPNSVPGDPNAGWTWNEFRQALLSLTIDTDGDGVPNQFGGNIPIDDYPIWIWSNGGEFYNDDFTATRIREPAVSEALQFWADLRNVDHVFPRPGELTGTSPTQFASGQLGLYSAFYVGAGNLATMELPFDWALAEFPRGAGGTVNRAAANPLAISSRSEHKEEAWEFVKFWLSDETQGWLVVETRSIPPQTRSIIAKYQDILLTPNGPPWSYAEFFLGASRMLPTYVPGAAEDIALIADVANSVWNGQAAAVPALASVADQIDARLRGNTGP